MSYAHVKGATKEAVAADVNADRKEYIPYGPPLWDGTAYVQLQVVWGDREPLLHALQDSNCPPTNTKAEKLMTKAVLPILLGLKKDEEEYGVEA